MDAVKIIRSVRSVNDLLDLAKRLGEIYQQADDPDGYGSVKIHYDPSIKKYAYTEQALFPHTDRSNMENPPNLILLWCEKKAKHGGQSLIFDPVKYLMPSIDSLNYEGIYQSENLGEMIQRQLYDRESSSFRFRHDGYAWIRPADYRKFSQVVDIVRKNSESVSLSPGDCLIIDNCKVFHGRDAYIGQERTMHRVLLYAKQ